MRIALIALFSLLSITLSSYTRAEQPLLIVTDPWPPYTIEENGNNISGLDADTIREVFKILSIPIKIQFCPWKRCLRMIEKSEADAILDASITPERKNYMYFPKEPVSQGITVFFKKLDRNIKFNKLTDLNGLSAAAVRGYSYCEDIDSQKFAIDAARTNSLKQSFDMLFADRVDIVIGIEAVGYYTAKQLGFRNKINVIPNARYCQGGNYLAFAQKPGHELLAELFGKALHQFKTTPEYDAIRKKYALID